MATVTLELAPDTNPVPNPVPDPKVDFGPGAGSSKRL